MKTATIQIHHVFGTKSTVFCGVFYRGWTLKYWMENETETELFNRAKSWAFSNGFTHVKVID